MQAVLRGPARARPRRVAPLDHRRDARPALRAAGRDAAGPPRRARPGLRRARARSTSRTSCSACTTRSTSPTSPRTPVLHRRPRPDDAAARAASAPTARSSGWPTSGPSSPTSSPHLTPAAEAAGRPGARASSPASRCACAATTRSTSAVARTNRVLSEAEVSPNYQKLLDLGDARTVGDLLAAGSESTRREAAAVLRRRRRHRPRRPRRARSATTATSSSRRAAAPATYLQSLAGSL